ncbi:hypothetical protein F5Y15DRAFT_392415 [Xylariaceae sp. FL0016]|nr:hypothetical protein F5Y15DRAFT_392415 [Xylariaceae sp. FL0016]
MEPLGQAKWQTIVGSELDSHRPSPIRWLRSKVASAEVESVDQNCPCIGAQLSAGILLLLSRLSPSEGTQELMAQHSRSAGLLG